MRSKTKPPSPLMRSMKRKASLPLFAYVLPFNHGELIETYRTAEEAAIIGTYNNDVSNALASNTRMVISETSPPPSSSSSSIQTGSIFNVRSFLKNHMPTCRGLIRNSSNKELIHFLELDDDIFEGKVVMICFFSLSCRSSTTDLAVARAVSLVSSELHFFGAFELVLVVDVCREEHADKCLAAFNDFMSVFPPFCLTVPLSECDVICESLSFSSGSEPTGLMVNRNQRVEWHKPLNFFLEYGADAYPFTPERFAMITKREENYDLWKQSPRISDFLCSNVLPYPRPSSFLRKNPGGGPSKTAIRNLESCVGLYLCYTGNLIPTLDEVHKSCCDLGMEFEIVLVYLPFKDLGDPQLFQDRINRILEERKISWWVLPFVYWVSRRLWRLCHRDTEDRLIMINTEPRFVEPHGEAVVRHFGIRAYPFSRDLLLESELKRLRAVTLESLLVHNSRDYVNRVYSGYPMEVPLPVASLRGKNVLLYLHYDENYLHLITNYQYCYYFYQRNAPYDLEVVFVSLNMDSSADFGSIHLQKKNPSPWLLCPFDPEHSFLVSEKIFGKGRLCSTLVAFGRDGQICSVRAQQLIGSSLEKSLFVDNLRNEMIAELFGAHGLPECCL